MSNKNNKLLNNLLAEISKSEEDENEDSKQISFISNKSNNSKIKLDRNKNINIEKMNIYNDNYENKITDLQAQISYLKSTLKTKEQENKSLKDKVELNNYEIKSLEKSREKDKIMNEEKYNYLQEKYNYEHEKYEEISKKIKEYQKKANEYDLINNQLKDLKEENKYLSEANIELNDSTSSLRKENIIINQKFLELQSSLEQLKIEKNGLNEKILFKENKIEKQEKIIKGQENEINKLKLSLKNYEQFMSDNESKLNISKNNLNTSFMVKNKINDEAINLKLKHEKEILNLKSEYEDIIKLKEKDYQLEKKEYQEKISNYELKLKEKQNSLDIYKSHIDTNSKKIEEEINALKLELDTKKKELESKNSLCQEQMTALAIYKNENEKLNEKFEFIRSELLLNESKFMKEIEELKTENVKLKEKIKINEDIDDELDKLLIDNKDIIDKNKKSSLNLKDLKMQKYNKCLKLINTIKRQNIEIEKLRMENTQLNNNLEMINEQCNVYKNISDKINQPYAYLVKSLQDKDLEKLQLNKLLLDKEQNINELKQQCEAYENKINSMKKDLAMIIKNREQINNLENLLQSVANREKDDNSNTDINRLNYFINNFNKSISFANK